jgi:hypothetical protein
MVDAPPFQIKELTGDKRTIRLVGRALPYAPYTLETGQRVEISWLPGNPVATPTVLGATEEPTQINGMWKDKYLGAVEVETPPFTVDGDAVLNVQSAIEVVDEFTRFGQMLEVTWLNSTRHGFLTNFRKVYQTTHDVEWQMEFKWVSRGDKTGPAVFITTTELSDTASELGAGFRRLDGIKIPKFGLSLGFLTVFQDFQHAIEDLVGAVEDAVVNFTDQVLSPVRAVKGVVTVLSGLETELQDLVDFVNGQVAGEINPTTPLPQQSFSERLQADSFMVQTRIWARSLQRIAVEHRTSLTHQIVGDILGTYVAKDGEDLRDVSRAFYNNPYEWRRIMLFNELTTAELTAGQLVLVPRMNPADTNEGN